MTPSPRGPPWGTALANPHAMISSPLGLVLIYLVAAVAGVVICRMAKLPPMLGYLAVGVLIGPNATALAKDTAQVSYLAEFGVVFLMFVIGLEFNLPKLRSMRQLVFGLGLSQVTLTILMAVAGNAALAWAFATAGRGWGLSWQSAIALGGALAMSSTAVVVKLMAERLELESEHGRRVMGVLLFQDLAVVPLLVLIPALGSKPAELLQALAIAALKAGVLLTVLLVGGQRVMRWWLTIVARLKSEELFVLNLLLVTLALAWLTEHAGLSLALGAFVAGMLIAETEYKHQVETDIRPFHDVLLGLFFITIGMKLDCRSGVDAVAAGAGHDDRAGAVQVRAGHAASRAHSAPRRAWRCAPACTWRRRANSASCCPALATEGGLLPPNLQSPVLASMVLSMLAAPFIVMYSNRIVMKLSATDWLMQSVAMTTIAKRSINVEAHIIICRLRPQRPEPGAPARRREDSRTWRSTSTPTACARPLPPARAWCSATPRDCRA